MTLHLHLGTGHNKRPSTVPPIATQHQEYYFEYGNVVFLVKLSSITRLKSIRLLEFRS
jgi:hypothetical protein